MKIRKQSVDMLSAPGLLSVLFCIFCITKVIRGTSASSGATGGIWNYITLIFYVFLFYGLFTKKHPYDILFFSATAYSLMAMLFSFVRMGGFDKNTVYSFLMIPISMITLRIFYMFTDDFGAEIFLEIAFWVCLGINFITILQYRFSFRARPFASDIYFSLGLLPFILLKRKGHIREIAIILEGIAVFFSGKRAGLLGFALAVIAFYLIDTFVKSENVLIKLRHILLISIILIVFYFLSVYLDDIFDTGIYERLERIQSDGGGGRSDYYATLWEYFKNSSILHMIFGHGMFSTEELFGTLVHNDFLEVLYDYGVVSLVPFVVIYISAVIKCIKMIKKKSPYAAGFIVSIICTFFLSMFSFMFVYYTYSICYAAVWGYCLKKEKLRLNSH